MHTVLLVFDIGSSGLKASLMDEDLNILRNVTTTYPAAVPAAWWSRTLRTGG